MAEIGNILREARIRKGLSIKDVSDATKIRSKYLEGLEQDDYEVIPGSTYVKAFLRSYASFLKLDADMLVEEYRLAHEPRRPNAAAARNGPTRQSRSRSIERRRKKRARRSQRGWAVVGVLAVVAVVLLAYWGAGRGGQSAAEVGPESLGGSTSTSVTSEGSATGGTTEGPSTSTSAVVSTGENVELVLSVTEGSCWLVVREDNKDGAQLFTNTLAAGDEETFDSSKRYWLRIGKPEVLVLTVNGVPHTLDEPAGDFIVTEAGIETTQ